MLLTGFNKRLPSEPEPFVAGGQFEVTLYAAFLRLAVPRASTSSTILSSTGAKETRPSVGAGRNRSPLDSSGLTPRSFPASSSFGSA